MLEDGNAFSFSDETYPLHDFLFEEHMKLIPEVIEKGEAGLNEDTQSLEIWHEGHCLELTTSMQVIFWMPLPDQPDKFIPGVAVGEEAEKLVDKILARYQDGS